MSDQARSIIETVFSFSEKGKITHPTIDIRNQEPFYIKEVKITPYTVDHSAYGAFMFLIEADGKRILYTGDYRNHGYKGKLFKPMLKKINKIDILLTEGTVLSRPPTKAQTEAELAVEIAEKTKQYRSSFNININNHDRPNYNSNKSSQQNW